MMVESLKECFKVRPGNLCRFRVKILLGCTPCLSPLLLISNIHTLSLLHYDANLVVDFLLGVLLNSVELLGDGDVKSIGRKA